MKGISLRSPEEIRRELQEEFNWDIEEMARNYSRSVPDMLRLIRCGGDKWKGNTNIQKDTRIRASYDVMFSPMVNVKVEVKDPENPTDEEYEAIVEKAFREVCDNAGEKLSSENVSMVCLYDVDGDPDGTRRDHYVTGGPEYEPIDPEILLELTQLTYGKLYEKNPDGVDVSSAIRSRARQLTEKYKNTDWNNEGHDFWLTMEQESEDFLKEYE